MQETDQEGDRTAFPKSVYCVQQPLRPSGDQDRKNTCRSPGTKAHTGE